MFPNRVIAAVAESSVTGTESFVQCTSQVLRELRTGNCALFVQKTDRKRVRPR